MLGKDAPPLLRAEVLACLSEDLAVDGRKVECLRTLDEADGAMAEVASSLQPDGGLSRYMRGYSVGNWRASSAIVMGKPADAIPVLEDIVGATGPGRALPFTGAMTDLGAAYALQHEPERSCELLMEALKVASASGLPQRVHRVRRTRDRYLERWSGSRSVRDLTDGLACLR